ncbi:MAG TPA: hypothetical protein VFD98_09450 [Terracidiphilus sp.]|nr:hypothetical protein [Terracidiphilus sp.]
MTRIEDKIRTLLQEAEATAARPVANGVGIRTAEMILQHGQMLYLLPQYLESILGERSTYAKLVQKVSRLLELCSVESDGSADWVRAFEQGRAGEVRRVLNDIRKLMEGEV